MGGEGRVGEYEDESQQKLIRTCGRRQMKVDGVNRARERESLVLVWAWAL